jgi:dTDP-4-dehydrorhamnose reductase
MAESAVLITGAGGYLGRRLVERASTRWHVYAGIHSQSGVKAGSEVVLDVTDRDAVMQVVGRLRPRAVIHTAAVNPGQGDETEMWRVNAEGSQHVAEAAHTVGARLVAVSTDIVHNGRTAPYADDVPPSPINGYGQSKAAGEEAIRAADPAAVVVRPSLIYGLDEMDRGTAGFAERIAAGNPQVLFRDVIRNPVWVETLAEALIRLATVEHAGVLNVAGRQALSREAFGRRMLAYWGVDVGDMVHPGLAADLAESIPLDLRLVVGRAEMLLGMVFPGVDHVLDAAGRD